MADILVFIIQALLKHKCLLAMTLNKKIKTIWLTCQDDTKNEYHRITLSREHYYSEYVEILDVNSVNVDGQL